ncbi:MAG: DUF2249 domain-containing protein [Gemmatimonadales bacterium]
MIRPTDTVGELLRGDEGLVDVLAELAPGLEGLRNPERRKVMSGLLTVEQVAVMAGLDPTVLVARLTDHTRAAAEPTAARSGASVPSPNQNPRPAPLAAIPERDIVRLDVREELRAGREPFSRIMAARRQVPDGGALCLRATFEPVPLYAVMGGQGFAYHTEQLAEDDWTVWFYSPGVAGQPGSETPASSTPRVSTAAEQAGAEAGVVVLDVRGLEPPEPMVRTLEALEALPDGHTLVQINVRVPEFLLPQLEERGFVYEIREQSRDLVRLFVRRAEPPTSDTSIPNEGCAMPTTRTLDVRIIPPREKHPTIFETFASLAPGESFVLLNDHDPRPLRYQFEYEHKDEFEWTYLEQGPTVWRVEIGRRATS